VPAALLERQDKDSQAEASHSPVGNLLAVHNPEARGKGNLAEGSRVVAVDIPVAWPDILAASLGHSPVGDRHIPAVGNRILEVVAAGVAGSLGTGLATGPEVQVQVDIEALAKEHLASELRAFPQVPAARDKLVELLQARDPRGGASLA
jgi:hypothetical protein